MKRKLMALAACIAVFAAFLPVADARMPQSFMPYAILPENQVDKSVEYFDLRMQPGQRQAIQVGVRNTEQYAIEVNLQVNQATTGRNGQLISYQSGEGANGEGAFRLSGIVYLKEATRRIEPGKSAVFDVELSMPDEAFGGMLLGGIVVSAVFPRDVLKTLREAETDDFAVYNALEYVIGLKITQSDDVVEPDFSIAAAFPGAVNYSPNITARIRNEAATTVGQAQIALQVLRDGEEIYAAEYEEVQFAPQSSGDFIIACEGEPAPAGEYLLRAQLKWREKTWDLEKSFTIDEAMVEQVRQNTILPTVAPGMYKEDVPGLAVPYIWLFALIVLVVGIAAVALVFKRKHGLK